MAFMGIFLTMILPMIILYFVAICIILGIVEIIGIVILIISLLRRWKYKKEGKKPKKLGLIIGSIFSVTPIVIVISFLIWIFFVDHSPNNTKAMEYSTSICSAIEDRDEQSLYDVFSVEMKERDEMLLSDIQRMYDGIDGNVVSYEMGDIMLDYEQIASDDTDDEIVHFESSIEHILTDTGAEYTIQLSGCVKHDEDAEHIGIERIVFVDETTEDKIYIGSMEEN